MRHRVSPVLFLLLAAFAPAAAQKQSVATLDWLVGCWERTTRTGRGFEQWSKGAAGELIGGARSITPTADRETERLRLFDDRNGLVYEAHPSDQRLTLFPMRVGSADSLVFENPAHDFPQRITYRRVGADSLIAEVGVITGPGNPIFFRFKRSTCVPPTAGQVSAARDRADLKVKYDSLALRERTTSGESNAWMVDNSDAGFNLSIWVVGGWSVRVVEREDLTRMVSASRAANRPPLRDRKFDVTIDRMLHRGDTTEVMVTTRNEYVFADSAGRFGDAGKDHKRIAVERRIETWMRVNGAMRLRRAEIVGAEVWIDEKMVNRDGVLIR
jgi:hypothetical protein